MGAAAAVLLLPVIALAVTEFAGVTHLFPNRDATPDHPDVAPGPIAKADPSRKDESPKKDEPPKVQPKLDHWLQRVAALPAEQQVEEVRKELMRRNPGFDGKLEHKIEGGVVTEFRIVTDQVTDIAPIRVFNALRVLGCGGTWTNKANGQLADLTPLKGMNLADLTRLDLMDTKVTDAEMVCFKECKNLTALLLYRTQVGDAGLVHFQDCKDLTVLRLDATQVSDAGLAHLKGCKALTEVFLGYTKVSDAGLANFKDCTNLSHLFLNDTQVSDAGLSHFKDCKNLTAVAINNTRVGDAGLAYLKGMPLRFLYLYNTAITDLTPLQGMLLEKITLTPKNITRGLDILRETKSLKTIGISYNQSWPAAEFWERYDKEEFGKAAAPFTDADVQRIAALPAAEQVEEVRKELMRRNPGFDGKLEHKIDDGVVTEFRLVTDKVTDIAPIRVWGALRVLDCRGTWTNNGPNGLLADLTPLEGMNLSAMTRLNLSSTKVGDAGMVHFKECKNLTNIDLFYTQVSDAGLVQFKDCKALTGLYLGRTKVSDSGLANFKDCKNLTDLWLHEVQVGDPGMVHFQACKALKSLNLAGTKVSDVGVACFKDCKTCGTWPWTARR